MRDWYGWIALEALKWITTERMNKWLTDSWSAKRKKKQNSLPLLLEACTYSLAHSLTLSLFQMIQHYYYIPPTHTAAAFDVYYTARWMASSIATFAQYPLSTTWSTYGITVFLSRSGNWSTPINRGETSTEWCATNKRLPHPGVGKLFNWIPNCFCCCS